MGCAREWLKPRPLGAVAVGVVNGLSGRLGEIKGYGNAVVPQIPELIGNAILSALNDQGGRDFLKFHPVNMTTAQPARNAP